MSTERINYLKGKLARVAERAAMLESQIADLVAAEKVRKVVELAQSKAKLKAKQLARAHNIEVDDEQKEFDRISVWPPVVLSGELDQFDCDHYVYNWTDALERVEAYVKDLEKYGN